MSDTNIIINLFESKNDNELEIIINNLMVILSNVFKDDKSKTKIKVSSYDINISCPICKDSKKTGSKKRGHLYLNSGFYHCYNCGTHLNINDFFNKFKKILKENNCVLVKYNVGLKEKIKLNNDILILNNSLCNFFDYKKYQLISLKDVIKRFNLKQIKGTHGDIYLKNIRGVDLKNVNEKIVNSLYFDDINGLLYFLNIQDGFVYSLVYRSIRKKLFNKMNLYLLLKEFYPKMFNYDDLINDNDFININTYLSFFNIFNVDLNSNIIISESQIDALILDNCISFGGLTNNFLNKNKSYFIFDYDTTGNKKSINLLKKGFNVFIWKKFLKDFWFNDLLNKNKVDVNDLLIYCDKNNIDFKYIKFKMMDYFSNDPLDMFYI